MTSGPASAEIDRSEWVAGLKQGALIGAAAIALILPPLKLSDISFETAFVDFPNTSLQITSIVQQVDFAGETASDDVVRLANWVLRSGDNQGLAFVLLDKKNTKVFVFDALGNLTGATPVLIGAALGDDSVTGIGSKPISQIATHERTTPAGRFIAESGRNASGEDVVWVDYDAAVSMHRVRALEPKERRLERLASPGTDDNRISYGCINVPVNFYESVVKPAFDAKRGIVYVLPELKVLGDVFTSFGDGPPKAYQPPAG